MNHAIVRHARLLLPLALLALALAGCARVVTSGNYVLPSGQTLNGDLLITSGNARLEDGSRVAGSLVITSGNVVADGQIDGDVVMTSGNLRLGPSAVVQGNISYTSGNVFRDPGARVEGAVGGAGGRTFVRLLAPLVLIGALLLFLIGWGITARGRPRPAPATPVGPPGGSLLAQPAQAAGEPAPAPARPALGGSSAPAARPDGASVAVALLLIGLGLFFLVPQFVAVDVWDAAWPAFIIVPGLLCLVGLALGGRGAAGLAYPGSFLTMLGLILLYQNATGHWESWAYAWALLVPTAVGLGQLLAGWRADRPDLIATGRRVAGIGLAIFLVGAVFFELALDIGGWGGTLVGRIAGPLLLIASGLYLLLGQRRPGGRRPVTPQPAAGAPSAETPASPDEPVPPPDR